MAWKTSAKIKSPKRTRRDLWVGFKPYGIGETKPNHYKEIAQDALGEPRQPAVRVAHPQPGRLRRVRARCRRLPRLDALGRAPLHDAAQPAAGQHDGGARSRSARRRRAAAAHCAAGSCATSVGSPTRWCGGGASPASPGCRGTKRSTSSPTASARPHPTGSRSTSPRAASPTRPTTSRRSSPGSSAPTTSTTRHACATRRRRRR